MTTRQPLKKRSIYIVILILLMVIVTACKSDSENIEQGINDLEADTEELNQREEEEGPFIPEGKVQSPFNGKWIPEEDANKRPIALQINNSLAAYPQSGIAQADIIYETLAEGNITRLMAVFHLYDSEKIGPIRSARHYFLDMAANHDAVYMHYGGSPQAYSYIQQTKAPNLDGLSWLDGIVCWRDPERRAIPRMLEHSVYTNQKHLEDGWERRELRKELKENFSSGLEFVKEGEEIIPWGQRADYVTIPFSASYTSSFDFDAETKKYVKYQSGNYHLDEEINGPLMFTNLILQRTKIHLIPGDTEGRREVAVIGSGTGYFISAGRAVAIEWQKASHGTATEYIEKKSGKPIQLNPGKTYIGILPQNLEISFQKKAINQ
ncbi:Protein of unknown function [Tindallia magadiensis]|uniref:DUF3048 domain-containing protein n=1 Tax=Tindallia magadiensis TaxID=69895 RepID=A0A1I3B4N1_9FIRM|nr:DUF3048 domain-containing protein [Tindallia magadiensis]SFH57268.1 Protein of unknown function [Tindallia magadiensis]